VIGRQRYLRRSGTSRGALTLIEILVSLVASSMIFGAMGSLLVQALLGYRRAECLVEGATSRSAVDAVMRDLLFSVDNRTVLDGKTFTYDRKRDDTGNVCGLPTCPPTCTMPGFPPYLGCSSPVTMTGIVYLYQNGWSTDSAGNPSYQESSIYWFETSSAKVPFYVPSHDSFTKIQVTEAQTLINTANFRRVSTLLARHVASLSFDPAPQRPGLLGYHIGFQNY
jgi:hypothetical protein